MKKSRLSEERIIEVLKQLEAGRKVSQLKRLKELEEENRRLKTLVADLSLDKVALKSVIKKRMEPVERREELRHVIECCLMSERRSSLLLGLDRSSHRYRPREKRHEELCVNSPRRIRATASGAYARCCSAKAKR